MKPKSLRQSSIKCWEKCRAQYFAQYILGINLGEYEPALFNGTMVHAEIEKYHLGKMYDETIVAPYAEVIKPVVGEFVEERFEFVPDHLGEKLPVPVTGIIDRVMPGEALYDLKTSSTSWSQRRADEDLQATLYLYYWYQEHSELLPFTFVIYRKDWKPTSRFDQIQTVTTTRSVKDFDRLWLHMYKTLEDISNEEEWSCACKNQEHSVWSNIPMATSRG